MSFLRRVFSSRFRSLGLLSDIAMVGAAASRVVRRPAGARPAGRSGANRPGELILVAGAAFRLLKRIRRVRRKRRLGGVD